MPDALAAVLRRAPLTPEKVAFSWRTAVGPAVDKVTSVELHDGVLLRPGEGRHLAARGRAFGRPDPIAARQSAGRARRALHRGRRGSTCRRSRLRRPSMEVADLATASETLVSPRSAAERAIRSAASGRRRVHDVHDPRAARELLADRTLRRAAGLHAVQRGRASGRARSWADCGSTTGDRSIPTPTSSCSPAATASRPATRCGW